MNIERFSSEECLLAAALNGCLLYAKAVHDRLGAAGLETVRMNQRGDTALRADIECEEAVIKGLQRTDLPIRVVSEEHGSFDVGPGRPKHTVLLDGLNGSSVYISSARRGGYGTMLGLFRGDDPCYQDYLWSGVSQHATGHLLIARKGCGVERGNVHSDAVHFFPCIGRTQVQFDEHSRIHIDEFFEINRQVFSRKLRPGHKAWGSECGVARYCNVVLGTSEAVLECTRKGNFEIATSYGLVREVGGTIIGLDGCDIGLRKVLSWGIDRHIPVITAPTRELALAIMNHINNAA